MGALTVADLVPGDAEPRIKDLVLAERLGFERLRDIRKLIARHMGELLRYGAISRHHGAKSGRGRPETGFLLNEAQTLLVCMLSETERAADVREEVIKVYMAWRLGRQPEQQILQRIAAKSRPARYRDPMAPVDERRAILLRMKDFGPDRDSDEMVRALVHLLPPGASGTKLRFPPWFHDKPVLAAVCRTHRQGTLDQVRAQLREEFAERAPSRGSLGRFWLRLDGLFGTARRLH